MHVEHKELSHENLAIKEIADHKQRDLIGLKEELG